MVFQYFTVSGSSMANEQWIVVWRIGCLGTKVWVLDAVAVMKKSTLWKECGVDHSERKCVTLSDAESTPMISKYLWRYKATELKRKVSTGSARCATSLNRWLPVPIVHVSCFMYLNANEAKLCKLTHLLVRHDWLKSWFRQTKTGMWIDCVIDDDDNE